MISAAIVEQDEVIFAPYMTIMELLLVDVVTKDAKAGLCEQCQAVSAVFAVTTQLEAVQVVVDVDVPEQFV